MIGVIVYPHFARKLDQGDAALLVLANPVATPPIALATSSEMERLKAGLPATMAGWGLTSFAQRLPTETLQSADTVVQGRKWCAANAPPFSAKGEICGISPRATQRGSVPATAAVRSWRSYLVGALRFRSGSRCTSTDSAPRVGRPCS